MPKEPIPIEDLTEKVLARMREHIEGKDVSEISIYEIEGGRSDQNWGVSIVRGGSDGPCAASRAAIFAMSELGKRYDLLADQ